MHAPVTRALPHAVAALVAALTLALAGCDRKPSAPPKPATEAAPAALAPTPAR